MPSPQPPSPAEAVRVVVQARPLLPFEAAHAAAPAVRVSSSPPVVHVSRPLSSDLAFASFDAVYASRPHQLPDPLYDAHVAPLVHGLFAGFNATVFAYGQTSAGKSYTMHHLTARVAHSIFHTRRAREAAGDVSITVRVGFVEIYRERIRDLVDGTRAPLGVVNVQVRDRQRKEGHRRVHTVFLDGAKERCVTEEDELMAIIHEGALVRQTAATGMNASSSRSHSIITLTVQVEPLDHARNNPAAPPTPCLSAKLHLVDLAGSERAKRAAVVGDRFAEGVEINKGLFALAKVISALADNASRKDPRAPKLHVPYRDSKLTRLLQDSLGGNARTLLVACVSPADTSREETLGTLRYAERAKCIRNRPKVNTDADSVEVSDLRARLARARAEIATLTAENERLRSCLAPNKSRMPKPNRTTVPRSPMSSPQTSSLTSSSSSPSPTLPRMDPLIITRDDDLITGLKYRIIELEDMLHRANLSASDRDALLGRDQGKVASRSPLGKLKNVGLAALSHVDPTDAKRKVEAKLRNANGPRRRARVPRTETSDPTGPSAARRREKLNQTDKSRKKAITLELQDQVDETAQFRSRSQSVSERAPAPKKRLPQRAATYVSRLQTNAKPSSGVFEDIESKVFDSEDENIGSSVMDGLSAAHLDEIRRTFLERLKQAEADKASLDGKRVQLSRRVAALQRKHEKEMEELKSSHQSRLATMRSKINDIKRLEAQSTRLTKLRDGSEAARKRTQGKIKVVERQRDEMASKLDDAHARAETVSRTLVKERKEMAKAERLFRAELRKTEASKSRYETIINKLRHENATMKNKLQDGVRLQVRRVNSSITST